MYTDLNLEFNQSVMVTLYVTGHNYQVLTKQQLYLLSQQFGSWWDTSKESVGIERNHVQISALCVPLTTELNTPKHSNVLKSVICSRQ